MAPGVRGYRIHPDVAWRLVDGVVFLLTPDSRYHQNDDPVGVAVWQALASAPPAAPPDLEALAGLVAARFDVERETAMADLAAFLDELVRAGAVETVAVPPAGSNEPHGSAHAASAAIPERRT